MIKLNLQVNGAPKQVICEKDDKLSSILRKQLGLTSVKVGCDVGQCGACSVILDGKLLRSCAIKMSRVKDGATVLTTEGIGQPGNLHPVRFLYSGLHRFHLCPDQSQPESDP